MGAGLPYDYTQSVTPARHRGVSGALDPSTSAEESASAGTDLNSHADALRALVHEMRDMVGTNK
jgi:hypothetical protein